ncbi:SMP-30/gluconolactonase/LRE family protein [Aliikangiella marina]|uniref:SMP-30/gluconolactonase/LRE family protein n=1 Tax=Aliikangiella marina TaxID=1712262 RepID=A0A545TJ53_9GAMM|nr:SMP-30/gluconolactonase/LRE family protein [Aliikangiella marina]TQV77238.1 SMP-30/gluconolactonase/LRE family protein [Aliikangiella marina]
MSKSIKTILALLTLVIVTFLIYLLFWPTPLQPQVWQPLKNGGYTGHFQHNQRLALAKPFSIGSFRGPEDIAIDNQGNVYLSSDTGDILRIEAGSNRVESWISTNGRPLGIDIASDGSLIVADAHRGLLSISPERNIKLLSQSADGVVFGFTDDVDIAENGKIYFSDASSKFSAKNFGIHDATILDLLEQGGDGRILEYDPKTGNTKTLIDNLYFANGVVVSPDQRFILFTETSRYRISKFWLKGKRRGELEVILDNLPAFPDNISVGEDGRFWVALHAPRNKIVDALAGSPFLRKFVYRLPKLFQPKPILYGHLIAIDEDGNVLFDLQDPSGKVSKLTSVIEKDGTLYLGNLQHEYFHTIQWKKSLD